MGLNMLVFPTDQGHIGEVRVPSQITEGANIVLLEIIPLEAELLRGRVHPGAETVHCSTGCHFRLCRAGCHSSPGACGALCGAMAAAVFLLLRSWEWELAAPSLVLLRPQVAPE